MRRIFAAVLAVAAVSAAAQGPSLEQALTEAQAIASAQPVRVSAALGKCWTRAVDERIDFTGMPMKVCVDRVDLVLPRNAAGEFYIEGAGIRMEPTVTTSARLTAVGTASHPGTTGPNGAAAFQAPLAEKTYVFGRKTEDGYRVWAHVFVTDTRIGEDALVVLHLNLARDGKVSVDSAELKAYLSCPEERCGRNYEYPEIPFTGLK